MNDEQQMMKMDLHCHSEASADCGTLLEWFPPRLRAQGIRVQAITDHNEIWGAQKLQEMVAAETAVAETAAGAPPLTVIVGEEVSTNEGEIIGLFLKEKIPAGLSPEETVARIQAQDGVVVLPHGFDPLKRYRLTPEARARVVDDIDVIEAFNARVSRRRYNEAAVTWAEAHDVPVCAGSDAHTLRDVGSAWVEVPEKEIEGPDDLLFLLEGVTPTGKWVHPVLAYIYKTWDRLRNRLRPAS